MASDYAIYDHLPGNQYLLVTVDAFRTLQYGIIDGLFVYFNQPVNNAKYRIHYYFGNEPLAPRIVEGSVKMGQPIEHPVWRFNVLQDLLPGQTNSLYVTHTWLSAFGLPGPRYPWLLPVCQFITEPGTPYRAVGPWMHWPSLPLHII